MTGLEVDRRAALGLLGAGLALPGVASAAEPMALSFRHGVASGDPTLGGAILWTRVTTTGNAPVAVRWTVSEREGGAAMEHGRAEAHAARDWTVKVEPRRLKPGREYWYWFEAGAVRSPAGRFRTLPHGHVADLVLAVASCQLYANGLFNAYDVIAKEPRLDAVLFLGDYIYEYDPRDYGGANAVSLGRIVEPAHETVTLADYRARHASYKTDPDLQAAHARAAWIAVWDDHEVANDSWTGGAANHQPATDGDWAARKRAALQAYFEWMPIRDPVPGKPWEAINRAFEFGDLATLLMVETRLLARSQEADQKFGPKDAASIAKVMAERERPEREMLGAPQREWLERSLAASVRASKPWQLLGNQVIMARVPGPVLEKVMTPDKIAELLAGLPPATAARLRASQALFKAGLPYNLDGWDGYPAARERLYAAFREAGSRPIVLSGDSHSFWACDLFDAAGKQVAVEFGTSSITSPSVGDNLPQVPLGRILEDVADEVVFCDQQAKGYTRLSLTRTEAKAEFVAVTIAAKPYQAKVLARYGASAALPGERLQRIT